MRGLVADLPVAHPIGEQLPSLYRNDEFAQQLTGALDEVLAPVFATLDNFGAYLDPTLAPADFLGWLAGWLGVDLDENWTVDRQRELVGQVAGIYRRRGTVGALAQQVALYSGVVPEIEDSGGVTFSATPGGSLPGAGEARLVVRVRVANPDQIDVSRIEAIVAQAKPAHVPHSVEVLPA